MGNDGGSIPTRRELVKTTKTLTASQLHSQQHLSAEILWSTCPISKSPLDSPILSDYKGLLYNKDSVIEWLISPEKYPHAAEIASHINSLRDVVELQIAKDEKGSWICPISFKSVDVKNGRRFVYLAECGHVFWDKALKEVNTESCPECGTKFSNENIIPINSLLESDKIMTEERIKRLISEGLSHSLKRQKGKKRSKKDTDNGKKKKKHKHNDNDNDSDKTKKLISILPDQSNGKYTTQHIIKTN